MRIVIDLQGTQTQILSDNANPSAALVTAEAIVRQRGDHDVVLALSGLFPETIPTIRSAYRGLLPPDKLRIWYAVGPINVDETGNEWRRQAAEKIRERFLASLKPDVVFVPSLFEGCLSDCISSIGDSVERPITVVALDNLGEMEAAEATASDQKHRFRIRDRLNRADAVVVRRPLTIDEARRRLTWSPGPILTGSVVERPEISRENAAVEGQRLIALFEERHARQVKPDGLPPARRPKLAFVSPLPPKKSGVADYSAELVPALARFYDIDVIVAQAELATPWITAHCGVRTVDWFVEKACLYDRILYHFGNISFHEHLFDLLQMAPGVVVLHDFHLGDVQCYRENNDPASYIWVKALYESHGYRAVAERFHTNSMVEVIRKYPANFDVLRQAQGIIVHSRYTRQMAKDWYNAEVAEDWQIIPLLRTGASGANRAESRRRLGLKATDFVVCSFGFLSPLKLNHRLLWAWIRSTLARDPGCILVFAGQAENTDYEDELVKTIRASGLAGRTRLTGWLDQETYRDYLAASDLAVQLRSLSRGETSAAVLDCLNHGIPTIVNANGSLAELPPDAVWTLPDFFEDSHLIEAMETLQCRREIRTSLSERAREVVWTRHSPEACAVQYARAIEDFQNRADWNTTELVREIARSTGDPPSDADCLALSEAITLTLPVAQPARKLFVDVTATHDRDLKTGIQRVVRALTRELIQAEPSGYRVEPVYLSAKGGRWHYRYARAWTSTLLEYPDGWLPDEPIELTPGDRLLVADYTVGYFLEGEKAGVYEQLRGFGVAIHVIVYDLLPLQMPDVFPPGLFGYSEWLNAVLRLADGVICISQTVADDLRAHLGPVPWRRPHPLQVDWFHLGADIENSTPTQGIPEDAVKLMATLASAPGFLMVGTIEPRKAHLQVVEAFSQLWKEGLEANLVLVGEEGWKGLADKDRRAIPRTIHRIRRHAEFNRRLFWLEDVSDEYLAQLYTASTCLIAASLGEGFGLPLLLRDIAVFREVAGAHACYFEGQEPGALAHAVKNWLKLNTENRIPASDGIPRLTWAQSAAQLAHAMLNDDDNLSR